MDGSVERGGFLSERDRILWKTRKTGDAVNEVPQKRVREGSNWSSTEVGRSEGLPAKAARKGKDHDVPRRKPTNKERT